MDWNLNKNIVVFILVIMVTNLCLCTGNHGNQQQKIHFFGDIQHWILVIKCTVKGFQEMLLIIIYFYITCIIIKTYSDIHDNHSCKCQDHCSCTLTGILICMYVNI